MLEIKYVTPEDQDFWYSLDNHLPKKEFQYKVQTRQGYVLSLDDKPVGLLRYNLFWDNIPFCTMLYIDTGFQGKSYGKELMRHWEKDMLKQGYGMLLTSTQSDEDAQHFYRKLDYKDCGGLIIDVPDYAQPMEIFFVKSLK